MSSRDIPTVLIVGDKDVRRALTEHLGRRFNVFTAADGREAERTILGSGCQIDLLITSRSIPGMFGEEVVRCFKKRYSRGKVIMMTSEELPPGVRQAIIAAGTNLVLDKPASEQDMNIFFAHIRVLMGQSLD